MTVMTVKTPDRRLSRRTRALCASLAICLALLAGGCGTSHPGPLPPRELAEAQTFPYYRVYWVGTSFEGHPLAAADGLRGYIDRVGDSVYYGDCVQSKGIFGGGSCQLPLQVTTVIYRLHSNAALGAQRNTLVRGVPATVYDEGHSIEVYSGRVAIDVFSDTPAHALRATGKLLPINAPGSSTGPLPLPIYCPGLSGPIGADLAHVMANLPGHACQRAASTLAFDKQASG
jgi:hypothetical protein